MTDRRWPRWKIAALAGAVSAVLCAMLPLDLAGLVIEVTGIAGVCVFLRATRRLDHPSPYRWLAAGSGAILAGNAVREIYGGIVGETSPFPSPGDFFFFAGYACLGIGLLSLVRRRSADIEGDNLLDAILLAVCIGTASVAFVFVPYGRVEDSLFAQAMLVGYTVGDLVLLSAMARLAVGSGRRVPAWYLLGGSVLHVLLMDVALTLGEAMPIAQRISYAIAPLPFALSAAAALHPSIHELTDRPHLRDIQLTPRRMGILLGAFLSLVALLLVAVLAGTGTQIAVTAIGAVLAVLLVLGRLGLLVQSNERKAAREASLRDAAGALAKATSSGEMEATTAGVLADLLKGTAWIVELGPVPTVISEAGQVLDDELRDDAIAAAVAATGDDESVQALYRPDRAVVLAARVLTRRGASRILVGRTANAVPAQMLHVVETLTSHLGGALDGLLLTEETYRREQEQRFRALVEHSSEMVTVLDSDGLVTWVSPACEDLLGVGEAHIVGRHPFERVHPDDRPRASGLLDRAWAVPGVLEPVEVRFTHQSGEWRWFEILVENLVEQPEVAAVIVHSRDVTDRRKAQEELETREARFRSLVQHNADLIAIVDDDLRLTYVSPAARSMLGFEPDSLVGRPITEIIPAELLFTERHEYMLPAMSEARMRDAGGDWRQVELTITDLRHDPAVAGIVVNARDVSERKTLEDQLRHLAMHDPLTGLANRNLLHERLDAALKKSGRNVAVLYLDIDDFKGLNDSLGHGFGDAALTEVARRLTASIREGDLAARLGGDEFAVLLEGAGAALPMEVGQRLLEAVRQPITLGNQQVSLTVSLGVAVRDTDSTVETLTRNADIAMYLAKTDGKDRRQLFVPEMLESFNERIELKRDLQSAIERGELRVVYQPVYDVRTGVMTGTEALVRWDHPNRGLVSPVKFIPLAEQSGVIVEIGAWVLDQACAQLAAWRAAGASDALTISVNLSVAQLEQDGLIAQVERTLLNHNLDPAALVLEVTESVLAANVDVVQLQLSGLSSLGVRLALDDFGTGYSSLGYLQQFEMDSLKIDRSFLTSATDPAQQEGMLRAIIDLAHSRGMSTTAEGVEEEEQLAMLSRLGVDCIQGFLFAKPLSPDEVLPAADNAMPYVAALTV